MLRAFIYMVPAPGIEPGTYDYKRENNAFPPDSLGFK